MLGLPNGVVIMADYDESWPLAFEREKDFIRRAIPSPSNTIEHIGSTSVPGLCAKPVIDILIGIGKFNDGFTFVGPLKNIGYHFKGENGIPFRHYFEKGDPRTHHIHMVEKDGAFWKEHILFRDYLRSHIGAMQSYADLKRTLAEKYPNNRDAYLESKAEFIQGIIKKARKSG
jgi:GrpB-like predicted nucleotidyltransferase (UPF0157 family)